MTSSGIHLPSSALKGAGTAGVTLALPANPAAASRASASLEGTTPMAHPDSPTQVAQGHLGAFDPGHSNASDVLMFDRTGLGTAAHTLTVLVTGKSSFLSRETTVSTGKAHIYGS
jgi:hypothetical protein